MGGDPERKLEVLMDFRGDILICQDYITSSNNDYNN
jgi:hypothetical protein